MEKFGLIVEQRSAVGCLGTVSGKVCDAAKGGEEKETSNMR